MIAETAWLGYRSQRRSFAPVPFGAIGVGLAIYDFAKPGTAGTGIYAAAIGSLLVIVGGYQSWLASRITSYALNR